MSEHACNVWIEIEEVEVVDQCDSFYEDRTDHLGYGKAGRFENLDEAVAFGQHLSRLAADDSGTGATVSPTVPWSGSPVSTRSCSWGNAHRSGRPRPRWLLPCTT